MSPPTVPDEHHLRPYSDGVGIRSLLVGAVAASALLVGACSTEVPDPTRPTGHLGTSWQRVTLSGALTPVTLAVDGNTVLIGAHSNQRPHPRILAGTGATALREVPLTPRSPYAFEGRWFQIISRDGDIDGIAGARGGAHGNYRWTTWSGSRDGVAEQEQPFGVFGSYGAGDLSGMAYAGGSPVVLGAWQSDRTGLDIATWSRSGARWARQQSTGTPLGSTPQELVGATAIASRGEGLALSGSVTRLAPGSVTVEPSLWTSSDGDGPWSRVDLSYTVPPKGQTLVEAQATTCSRQRCVVSGVNGGWFTFWEMTADTISTPPGIPEVELTENASVLAPVTLAGTDIFVVPTADGSTVLQRDAEAWSVGDGPSGSPVSAIVHGDELWLVTTDAQGTGTLWRSRVT